MTYMFVRKNDLSTHQSVVIDGWVREYGLSEIGPIQAWSRFANGLYAYVRDDDAVLGLVEASGRPICSPGWWLAPEYRRAGIGKLMVRELATYLKADGVTVISEIPVKGEYWKESEQLKELFLNEFGVMKLLGGYSQDKLNKMWASLSGENPNPLASKEADNDAGQIMHLNTPGGVILVTRKLGEDWVDMPPLKNNQ